MAKEKEIAAEQVKNKPPQAIAKIVEGKLEKFYQGCLPVGPGVCQAQLGSLGQGAFGRHRQATWATRLSSGASRGFQVGESPAATSLASLESRERRGKWLDSARRARTELIQPKLLLVYGRSAFKAAKFQIRNAISAPSNHLQYFSSWTIHMQSFTLDCPTSWPKFGTQASAKHGFPHRESTTSGPAMRLNFGVNESEYANGSVDGVSITT
jgi:hypothetical protein